MVSELNLPVGNLQIVWGLFCLPVYLPIYLPICLSVYLSIIYLFAVESFLKEYTFSSSISL